MILYIYIKFSKIKNVKFSQAYVVTVLLIRKFYSIQLTKICHSTKIRTKYLGFGGQKSI